MGTNHPNKEIVMVIVSWSSWGKNPLPFPPPLTLYEGLDLRGFSFEIAFIKEKIFDFCVL